MQYVVEMNYHNKLHLIFILFKKRMKKRKQQHVSEKNCKSYSKIIYLFCAHAVHSTIVHSFVNDFTISGIFHLFHVYRPIFVSQLVHVTQNVYGCACPCDDRFFFLQLSYSFLFPFQFHFVLILLVCVRAHGIIFKTCK